MLANVALRFGDAGETFRGGVRRVYALARGASGLAPVSTGTMTFDPAAKDLGMSPLSGYIARRCDPATIVASDTSYFSTGIPGNVGQSKVYVSRSTDDGATWATTAVADMPTGHQFFPDGDALAGRLAVVWQDNSTDPAYSVQLPVGNTTSATSTGTDVVRTWVAVSTDGSTFGSATQASSVGQQPQYEMHGMNMTGQDHSDGAAQGPGGIVSNSVVWGANDATANTSSSTGGHYYRWGVQTSQSTLNTVDATYHQFPCSKCHTPHVSRLPRLMKTNCLDNDNVGTPHAQMAYVTNGTTVDTTGAKLWGNMFRNVACHSTKIQGSAYSSSSYVTGGGWNNKTPW